MSSWRHVQSIKSCMLVWLLNSFHLYSHQHDLQASQTHSSKTLSKLKKLSKAYQVLCFIAWYISLIWEEDNKKWFKLCNWIYTNTKFLCSKSVKLNLHSCAQMPLADENLYLTKAILNFYIKQQFLQMVKAELASLRSEERQWIDENSRLVQELEQVCTHFGSAQWLNICLLVISSNTLHLYTCIVTILQYCYL